MGIFDSLFKPDVDALSAERNVKGIIRALGYRKDQDVQQRAARALVKIGYPVVEALIAALKDPDRDIRGGAARALGKIGNVRAVEPLIGTLKDQDRGIRERAGRALVKIGNPAAEFLIAALKDADWNLRGSAAETLGKLGWHPDDQNQQITYLIVKEDWKKLG